MATSFHVEVRSGIRRGTKVRYQRKYFQEMSANVKCGDVPSYLGCAHFVENNKGCCLKKPSKDEVALAFAKG